jgi:two-component system NarL family response regulator
MKKAADQPIRVLLADDHTMVRQALQGLLEKDSRLTVVAEAKNGVEMLALIEQYSPHIVIMDVSMPDMNGIEATKHLLASHPDIKVLALSAYTDKRFVMGMLEAGATGYIIKAEAGEELLRAIHSVMAGQTYLCPSVSALLVENIQGKGQDDQISLAPREQQVLKLLATGLTSPEIGVRLHIAPTTVEVHRRNIMRKLGVRGIAELTKYAIREGLVTL